MNTYVGQKCRAVITGRTAQDVVQAAIECTLLLARTCAAQGCEPTDVEVVYRGPAGDAPAPGLDVLPDTLWVAIYEATAVEKTL